MLQLLNGNDWDILTKKLTFLVSSDLSVNGCTRNHHRPLFRISTKGGTDTQPQRLCWLRSSRPHWPSEAHRSPPPGAEAHWSCCWAAPPHCSRGSSRRRSWGCRGSSASLSWRCTGMLERETTHCGQLQHILLAVMQWENPNAAVPPQGVPIPGDLLSTRRWRALEVTLKDCYSTCDS